MTRVLPFLIVLVGCDENKDTTEDVWPYCDDVETLITADEETNLGLTGADLVDGLPASAAGEVEWSGGSTAGLTWGFAADTDTLRYVESTAVYPEPEEGQDVPSIAVECPDYLAVDGILSLSTDDGQLSEAVGVTMSIDEHSAESLSAAFFAELSELGGSLSLSDYLDESELDTVRLFLSGTITEGVLAAELTAQGEGTDGDVAFATSLPIGTLSGSGE